MKMDNLFHMKHEINTISSYLLTFPFLVPSVSRHVVISATGLWWWALLRGRVHTLEMFPL